MFKYINRNTFRVLWPFFVYKTLKGVLFVTSITFFIFFQEKGIDYARTSVFLSLLFILPVFFEIITGVFADAFGRKNSVLIGYFGESLIIAGILASNNYLVLLSLFIAWGIILTFSSGADDAWAIESIPEHNKENIIDSYYSLSASFYSIGMILAGLLSSFSIIAYGQSGVWFARLLISICIVLIFVFTREKNSRVTVEQTNIGKYFLTLMKGFHSFRANKTARYIILGEIFATISLVGIGSVIMQKYLIQSRFIAEYWGVVYSVAALIGVIIPTIAIKISRKFSHQKSYLMAVMFFQGGLFLLASMIFNPIFAALFILFHNSLEEAFNPINSAFFQKEILPSVRATMGSLQAASVSLAAALGSTMAGFLIQHINVKNSIISMSFFIFIALVFYGKIKTPEFQKE